MIVANNHYAGFGPGTVNIFRNMVGMSELSWEDQQQIQVHLQQQKEQEKDFPIDNSNIPYSKKTKKRQTSKTNDLETMKCYRLMGITSPSTLRRIIITPNQ